MATLADTYDIVGESAEFHHFPGTTYVDIVVFDLTPLSLRAVQGFERDAVLIGLMQPRNEHLQARALACGVAGLLVREGLSVDRLKYAIYSAIHGQTSLPSPLVRQIMSAAADALMDNNRNGLLAREVEILQRLAAGGDTRAIATEMSYSERTVKNIVHDLIIKMNCRNRVHAVAMAARQGII